MNELTLEVANEWFEYDPEIGELRWRKINKGYRKGRVGDICGSLDAQGYRCVRLGRKTLKTHRIIWLLHTGEMPKGQIDHVGGLGAGNYIANLRLATNAENTRNAAARTDNTSGVKGVTWHGQSNSWGAKIAFAKRRYSKYFNTLEEAKEWIEFVREELHGAFTNHGKFEVQNGY